jgi:hypothetical protein
MTELLLAALLAMAVVVFVSVPFLRADPPPQAADPDQDALAVAEERDRALAELKDLEFDHRTGKITDEDYRTLVQPLRRRAAQSFRNGGPLSSETAEPASEQHFSERSLPSSRSDR